MHVVLNRSLSFTSIRSYTNYRTTKLGDINGDGKVDGLMTELTTGKGFKAIGKKEYVQSTGFVALTGFDGVFDGCGYTIKDLYINENTKSGQGLFSYISPNGLVKNLTVTGNITGVYDQGGIAAENDGIIQKCYNRVNLNNKSTGDLEIGGITGKNGGRIENCYNFGSITSENSSWTYTGGIAGINESIINKCYNKGKMISFKGDRVLAGGIVGYNMSGISLCYNTGKIEGTGSSIASIGGIARKLTK